jgi:cell shape-determining protein MreC
MNYLLKSSSFEDRKKQARKRVIIISIILIIALLLLATGPAKKMFFSVAEPVWQAENSIFNSKFFQYFKSKRGLMDEKLALEQKLFLAGNLMALNQTLETENENLKDLLGRKDTAQKTILAAVLVKPPQTPYDSLIIDIGVNNNLKVGDKVMANANIYIGDVSEVLPSSAKVSLYSTPGRKLSVVINNSSVTAEAVGVGGGNFNILLPREIEVKEGDVITIPSITANVFGIVEKVNFKDKDSFQTVLFKSPVNVSELSFVEVVVN